MLLGHKHKGVTVVVVAWRLLDHWCSSSLAPLVIGNRSIDLEHEPSRSDLERNRLAPGIHPAGTHLVDMRLGRKQPEVEKGKELL